MSNLRLAIYSFLFIFLCACADSKTIYAPVVDVETIESIPSSGTHRVLPGETLYSIAWRYGLDYRVVAQRNHLSPPYAIQVGQVLYLRSPSPYVAPAARPIMRVEQEPRASVAKWQWPARGPIIKEFGGLNKGINIGGHLGDPIYTTAAGKVVYCGNGLRGYGELIIIQHNSTFLTAYAHNRTVFVKQGQWVKAGQQIAEMGNTGSQIVMLHFEIRRNGLPVNPLVYLRR